MTPHTLPESLRVYLELAGRYDQLGQASMRDRFLILAADAALTAGMVEEAERLRHRLLQGSRHHMLKPYGSFAQAASSPDVETYIRDLRVNYPAETARALLETLRDGASTAPPPAPPSHYPATIGGDELGVPSSVPETLVPPPSPQDRWPSTVVPIPATSPVIDIDGDRTPGPLRPAGPRPGRPQGLPQRGPISPTAPLEPPFDPGAPSTGRPRGQPRPAGPDLPQPPNRPRRQTAYPGPAPAPAPVPTPPTGSNSPGAAGGAWFSTLLGLVALFGAAACAAFALGKAFWPT